MHVDICNMHVDICDMHVDICNMHVTNTDTDSTNLCPWPVGLPGTLHDRAWVVQWATYTQTTAHATLADSRSENKNVPEQIRLFHAPDDQ